MKLLKEDRYTDLIDNEFSVTPLKTDLIICIKRYNQDPVIFIAALEFLIGIQQCRP